MRKLSFLPVLALLFAVGASAFHSDQKPAGESRTHMQIWQYQPVNGNGPTDPLNYVKLADADEEFTCDGGSTVCRILAEENLSTHRPEIPSGDDPSVQIQKYQTSFRSE